MKVYNRIASLLPKRIVNALRDEIDYSGINVEEKRFIGFVLSFSFGLSLALAFNLFVLLELPLAETFIGFLLLFLFGSYYWLNAVSESKGSFVEKILPDALQLIASNIRSGMTTERALFASARPEFGPLSFELKNAGKKVLSGYRLDVALTEITKKIKSRTLERTMWLLTQGIRNGGQIAELLTRLSDDLRTENSLKEEIAANINMYILMILVSAALGAPVLLAISTIIVQIIAAQAGSVGVSPEQISALSATSPVGGFVGVPEVSISGEFIVFFGLCLLAVTALFSSIVIGIIQTGKENYGIRFAPVILAVDIVLFFLAREFLSKMLGSAIGV